MAVLEVEVDTPTNADLFFAPAQHRVRGAFRPARVASQEIGALVRLFPDNVPGQRIRIDADAGTCSVLEPLNDAEHAKTKAAVVKQVTGRDDGRVDFDPAERPFPGAHVPTWVAWVRRAVAAGLARVVKGKLPDADPADAKRELFKLPTAADPRDDLIRQLAALALASLPAERRKEVAALIGK